MWSVHAPPSKLGDSLLAILNRTTTTNEHLDCLIQLLARSIPYVVWGYRYKL